MSNLLIERILLIYQHLAKTFNTDSINTLNIYDETQNNNTLDFLINDKFIKITITQVELFADRDTFNLVLDRIIADTKNQLWACDLKFIFLVSNASNPLHKQLITRSYSYCNWPKARVFWWVLGVEQECADCQY